MSLRLVDTGWGDELTRALQSDPSGMRVVSPFIKVHALERLLTPRPASIRIVTRFNLDDFADGVSDIAALRRALKVGARVRGIRGLHAKLYMFGNSHAIVTSANLTCAGLDNNHEFGAAIEDSVGVAACQDYFNRLWNLGGEDLRLEQLDEWTEIVIRQRIAGGRKCLSPSLGDFGAGGGPTPASAATLPPIVAEATQSFGKFLGQSDERVPLSCSTPEEIERAGCHRLLAYPATKRPRSVRDDALMFIARLTEGPDIMVFGRAIGMRYVPGRDDATTEEIHRRPWRKTWSRYIRVHQAAFVAGTMRNGVSLNELMDTLGSDSFAATQRNAAKGRGDNTNPRRAYLQAASVELSSQGRAWLQDRLQGAFTSHGTVSRSWLDTLPE